MTDDDLPPINFAAVAAAALGAPPAAPLQPRTDADRELSYRDFIEAAKRRTARERYEASCPAGYRDFKRDHPKLRPYHTQIDLVLAWTPDSPMGLLLSGPTGRGKTRCMWELIRILALEHGRDVVSYHSTEFFSRLQENIRFGNDDARGWIEAVAARPLVFIDDFGQEAIQRARQDWTEKWFMRFLDMRMANGRPLLLTTNLTARDIAADGPVAGDPLVRRLVEICQPIPFAVAKNT